jgi:hypothetical protein
LDLLQALVNSVRNADCGARSHPSPIRRFRRSKTGASAASGYVLRSISMFTAARRCGRRKRRSHAQTPRWTGLRHPVRCPIDTPSDAPLTPRPIPPRDTPVTLSAGRKNSATGCARGGVVHATPPRRKTSLHLRTHKYPERYIGCDGRGTAGNEKGVLGKSRCPIEQQAPKGRQGRKGSAGTGAPQDRSGGTAAHGAATRYHASPAPRARFAAPPRHQYHGKRSGGPERPE